MSAFDALLPHFAAFLKVAKDQRDLVAHGAGASANARFIPRNFLLDERLAADRLAGYAGVLGAVLGWNFHDWDAAHKRYLARFVFLRPPANHDPQQISTNDPNTCPETFRFGEALAAFRGTDRQTYLLRLVRLEDLAYLSEDDAEQIWALAGEWVHRPDSSNPAQDGLARILEQAATGPRCDHRPVFASFYEDLSDDLRQVDWPDRIRDRLGLYHIGQGYPRGLPARVLLFRYRVEALPRRREERETRPIAVPSVLDHRFSEAFCPAPRELNRGRVVSLQAGDNSEPAREVLHPFMPFKVEYLFRVGEVTKRVPDALDGARRDHLLWLQLMAMRDDYATQTDVDLLT